MSEWRCRRCGRCSESFSDFVWHEVVFHGTIDREGDNR